MKLVFMGTPFFAVPTLEILKSSGHEILAVITQPDRPKGRGLKLSPPPIKQHAENFGIEVIQPKTLSSPDLRELLTALKPDLFVVVAFSILPRSLLEIPSLGSINLHPSLLPAYRGAAPIIWAIANGEVETGVTTFILKPNVDTGDILLQKRVAIHANETSGELEKRLSILGADLVLTSINQFESGILIPKPQSKKGITRAPKLTKSDAKINWALPADQIHNRVRGFNPFPGAFTTWKNGMLRIHQTACVDCSTQKPPGYVLDADPKGDLLISCGENALSLLELQPAGKKKMTSEEFLRGNILPPGRIIGN